MSKFLGILWNCYGILLELFGGGATREVKIKTDLGVDVAKCL